VVLTNTLTVPNIKLSGAARLNILNSDGVSAVKIHAAGTSGFFGNVIVNEYLSANAFPSMGQIICSSNYAAPSLTTR
jgi:hypothetical protein